ncbi:hypothetical protein PV336_16340 [Streptomyces sp. MI02-2A]|uniref:hypothetical protein n=1 Tax=Streptomyces sp. MI02-2A TaxID=3028688 RepID=UPI0029BD52ED|nr:hypothetical protein [Streptomyces sp. MI02-2A]MDX3260791.1 hypothetical protein [Streptomyces sp. MI02-2A]
MDIKVLELDDAENPEFITVRMSVQEAAFLARVTGGHSGDTAEEVLPGGATANRDIYSALVGSVFNRYWDGGINDYLLGRE